MKTDVTSEPIFLNPLGLLEEGDSSERVLRFLCSHEIVALGGADACSIAERHGEIRPNAGRVGDPLAICRFNQKDLDEILWPLRAALSAFCTGRYLAAIAMAAVAVEQLLVRESPDTRDCRWTLGKRLERSDWGECDLNKGKALRDLRNAAVHRAQGGKPKAIEAFRVASFLVSARLGWCGPGTEPGTIVLPPERP